MNGKSLIISVGLINKIMTLFFDNINKKINLSNLEYGFLILKI
jgi:hypothetical protein